MNEKIVDYIGKEKIYFIETKLVSYYLSIPDNKFDKVNICINVENNKNESKIIDRYKNLSKGNYSIITTVFKDKIINCLDNLTEGQFLSIDKCISLLINKTYKRLKNEQFTINDKILLIHHDNQSSFEEKFLDKYSGRVEILQEEKRMRSDINDILASKLDEINNNEESIETTNSIFDEEPVPPITTTNEIQSSIFDNDYNEIEKNNEEIIPTQQKSIFDDDYDETLPKQEKNANNYGSIFDENTPNLEKKEVIPESKIEEKLNEIKDKKITEELPEPKIENGLKSVPRKLVDANTITIEDTQSFIPIKNKKISAPVTTKKKEPGFLSFILLGIVSAIIALIGLYFIL